MTPDTKRALLGVIAACLLALAVVLWWSA